MTIVTALIHGEPGAYGISFPDFPGLAVGGATVEEALSRAREGLNVHVEALQEDGITFRVRGMEAVLTDPDLREDIMTAKAVTAIDVLLPGKSIKVTITMDDNLMQRVDRAAKAQGESRSGYLAQAARERLAG